MRNSVWGLLLLAMGLYLGGCTSSNFHDAAFNATASKVHTIGILSISPPPGLNVFHAVTAGETFEQLGGEMLAGPGGAAIVQGDQQSSLTSMGAAFTRAIEGASYHIETNLTDALARDLRGEGYNVVIVNVSRSSDAFLTDYPDKAGIDAYLDVYFKKGKLAYLGSAGYLKKFRSKKYYAYMHIAARLVKAGDGKVLYSRQTIYNSWFLPIGVNLIKPDQNYGFSDYAGLMKNIKHAIEGFQVAVGKVAQATASNIQ